MISKEVPGLSPEVVAAISASISMMLEDDASPELVAAITAAIVHARRAGLALRIKRTSNAWGAVGRQLLMDSRL